MYANACQNKELMSVKFIICLTLHVTHKAVIEMQPSTGFNYNNQSPELGAMKIYKGVINFLPSNY